MCLCCTSACERDYGNMYGFDRSEKCDEMASSEHCNKNEQISLDSHLAIFKRWLVIFPGLNGHPAASMHIFWCAKCASISLQLQYVMPSGYRASFNLARLQKMKRKSHGMLWSRIDWPLFVRPMIAPLWSTRNYERTIGPGQIWADQNMRFVIWCEAARCLLLAGIISHDYALIRIAPCINPHHFTRFRVISLRLSPIEWQISLFDWPGSHNLEHLYFPDSMRSVFFRVNAQKLMMNMHLGDFVPSIRTFCSDFAEISLSSPIPSLASLSWHRNLSSCGNASKRANLFQTVASKCFQGYLPRLFTG